MNKSIFQAKVDKGHKPAKKTVLVVDDESDIVDTIKLWLQKRNFTVYGFADPMLALEHFKKNSNRVDLVLSDIRMPQMNGYEFVNKIKILQPKVKVILMSAFEIKELEFSRVFPSNKVDNLISKPISMKKLTERIKIHLGD
jgi:response regulator RpfG family c-di-GMP phosphodiesterase